MLGLALCTDIPILSQSPIDTAIEGLTSADIGTRRTNALYALVDLSGQKGGIGVAIIALLMRNLCRPIESRPR